ncbi:MAG TPA: hypothetical protein VFJ70_11085 [Burkholderiales bacterium]|nr:hypothetical protein [Burkholderiales bacterium]
MKTLAAAWKRIVFAARRTAPPPLDARTLRDIGIESYQPGLAERIHESKRLAALL